MNNLRNNLPLLYDFYIVAKGKTISETARMYNTAQPVLSRNIKELEEILGLNLISRSNKGISLTKDGEELFEKLDSMFSVWNDLENNENDNVGLTGKLIIGTTRNIADNRLSTYLTKFNKLYPNVKISILIDSARKLSEELLNHKIDVLFDYVPNTNFTERDNVSVKIISSFNTCFACSRSFYEKEANKINKVANLNNYELVIPGSSRRRQILDLLLTSLNIKLSPMIQMPDSKLMADFVKANDSIGYFIEDEVKQYDLVPLNLDIETPKNSIGIVYSKNTANMITKKFVEVVLNEK